MTKRINLYPHQVDIVAATEPYIACFGGVGSGKSYGIRLKGLQHAQKFPGTNMLAMMMVKEDLRKKFFAHMIDDYGPYIRHVDRQTLIVTLINGTRIYCIHAWDDHRGVDHIAGYDVSCVMLSQAEEMPKQTWDCLPARNRKKITAYGQPIDEHLYLVEGNPKGKGWIWEKFVRGSEETIQEEVLSSGGPKISYSVHRKPGSVLINCQSADYNFVPAGFLKSITDGHSERYINRNVKGKWEQHTGLVYEIREDIHWIDPFPIPKILPANYRRLVSIDWGKRNPTGMLIFLVDIEERTWFAYHERYQGGMDSISQARACLEEIDGPVDICIMDRTAWDDDPRDPGHSVGKDFADIFYKERGILVKPSKGHRREDGIEAVAQRLKVVDGLSRIYLFKGLKFFRQEVEHYHYQEDPEDREPKYNLKEEPLKKDDHLMDCWKNGVEFEKELLAIRKEDHAGKYRRA